MLESETHTRREKEKPRQRERERRPGIKTSSGSMKPPNLVLRGRLDHNVTTNRGNKQLVGKQNSYRLCLRLRSSIVWTLKAYVEKKQWASMQHPAFSD